MTTDKLTGFFSGVKPAVTEITIDKEPIVNKPVVRAMPPGVTLFEELNFQGKSLTITGDTPSIAARQFTETAKSAIVVGLPPTVQDMRGTVNLNEPGQPPVAPLKEAVQRTVVTSYNSYSSSDAGRSDITVKNQRVSDDGVLELYSATEGRWLRPGWEGYNQVITNNNYETHTVANTVTDNGYLEQQRYAESMSSGGYTSVEEPKQVAFVGGPPVVGSDGVVHGINPLPLVIPTATLTASASTTAVMLYPVVEYQGPAYRILPGEYPDLQRHIGREVTASIRFTTILEGFSETTIPQPSVTPPPQNKIPADIPKFEWTGTIDLGNLQLDPMTRSLM